MDPKDVEHLKPAFPTLAVVGDTALSEGGVTMRDYFAAKAMAAYLRPSGTGQTWAQRADFDYIAETAYLAADAMLRARGQS